MASMGTLKSLNDDLKLRAREFKKVLFPGDVFDLLRQLPARENTLARLYLHTCASAKNSQMMEIYDTLQFAVPNHLIAGMEVLCEVVANYAGYFTSSSVSSAQRGAIIAVLESVLEKMKGAGFDQKCLTPIHTNLLCLRMIEGDADGCLPLASRRFETAFAPNIYAQETLAFFYYAGIVHTWKQQYENAEKCFELVCLSPMLQIPSWITVCAFRKYMLTALIVHGDVPPAVPERLRFLTDTFRYNEASLAGYVELAQFYSKGNVLEFRRRMMELHITLRSDGNLGLAKRAEMCILQHLVKKMRSLYTSCTFGQILRRAHLKDIPENVDEVRNAVDSLIAAKTVPISYLDAEHTMIKFEDDPAGFSSQASIAKLESRVHHVLEYSDILEDKRQSSVIQYEHGQRSFSQAVPETMGMASSHDPRSFQFGKGFYSRRGFDSDDDSDDDFDN